MGEDRRSSGYSSVTLRPVRPDDELFLRQVYGSTRAEALSRTQLEPAQQQAFIDMQFKAQREDYLRRFPDAEHHVVLRGDQRVGRLYVAQLPEEFRILDVTILPEYRNTGIGTGLLTNLLNEAARGRKPVRIYLDNGSPSTRLFERLGFTSVEEQLLISLYEWRTAEPSRDRLDRINCATETHRPAQ